MRVSGVITPSPNPIMWQQMSLEVPPQGGAVIRAQDLNANKVGLWASQLLALAGAQPAVKSGASRGSWEPATPCLEVQGPLTCRTLKDNSSPRGHRSRGQRSKGRLAKRGPQDLSPSSLPGRDAGAEVSG